MRPAKSVTTAPAERHAANGNDAAPDAKAKPSASGKGLAKRECSMRKPGSAATSPEYWNWWAMMPKPFHSGDVAFELCYLHDMPAVLRALAGGENSNREMRQQLDAAKTSGGFLQGGQRAGDGGELRS